MTNTRSNRRPAKAAPKPTPPPRPTAVARIETIGPERAMTYLEGNTHNRKLSTPKVRQYAARMSQGRWLFSGQAHVIFSDEGVLLNGQHTLWAVVESGATITTVVVEGIDPEAFNVIDIGMKRSAGVLLAANAVKGAGDIGAAIRLLIIHDSGLTDNRQIDADEVVDLYLADPDLWGRIQESLASVRTHATRSGVGIGSRAAIGAFMALADRAGHDLDDVTRFAVSVADDADHETGKPATTLRRFLIRPGRARQITVLSGWIKAWNAHQAGVSFQKLYTWTGVGDTFPKVD